MNELILIALWAGIMLHWFYVHFSFRNALRKNDPELYQAHSAKSFFKYTSGRAWVDLALDGGHHDSNCVQVIKYGDRLKASYDNLLSRILIFIGSLIVLIIAGRVLPV